MNKITGISEVGRIAGKKKVSKTAESELFQKTLEGALDVKSSGKSNGVSSAGQLGEIQSITPAVMEDSTHRVGHHAEKLLNQLDGYIQQLGDPSRTLRDMEPSVKAMKQQADELLESLDAQQVSDGNLREVAERSALMANVEFIKFNRGDYL